MDNVSDASCLISGTEREPNSHMIITCSQKVQVWRNITSARSGKKELFDPFQVAAAIDIQVDLIVSQNNYRRRVQDESGISDAISATNFTITLDVDTYASASTVLITRSREQAFKYAHDSQLEVLRDDGIFTTKEDDESDDAEKREQASREDNNEDHEDEGAAEEDENEEEDKWPRRYKIDLDESWEDSLNKLHDVYDDWLPQPEYTSMATQIRYTVEERTLE
ncbi:hypothetical protein BGZ83_009033 [Gryganskiella cystojenkinii]|nr:hypothetical protein BGZ83_009033 [Gryganskiella cystojenkinii]